MIWETLLLGLHVVVAAALIGFVLLQHGKGADMGAFGSGSSKSFRRGGIGEFPVANDGHTGNGIFLSSLGLTYLASNRLRDRTRRRHETGRHANRAKGAGASDESCGGAGKTHRRQRSRRRPRRPRIRRPKRRMYPNKVPR